MILNSNGTLEEDRTFLRQRETKLQLLIQRVALCFPWGEDGQYIARYLGSFGNIALTSLQRVSHETVEINGT